MRIKLTQGKYAIVDDDLATIEMVSSIPWTYDATTGYARNQKLYMHRMIALPDPNKHIDHINGNKLDNRRCNLREATVEQNMWNGRPRKDNKTGYRGVRKNRNCNTYTAGFFTQRQYAYVGSFSDPIEAALAADLWAIQNRGEYARTNFLRYEE